MKKINIKFMKSAGLRAAAALLAQGIYIVPAYAATTGVDISTTEKVVQLICSVASSMFLILIVLSTVMVLWGAFLYLTAGGDSEKVSNATKTLTYAAVGVVVALLAKGFPSIVASVLSVTLSGAC